MLKYFLSGIATGIVCTLAVLSVIAARDFDRLEQDEDDEDLEDFLKGCSTINDWQTVI